MDTTTLYALIRSDLCLVALTTSLAAHGDIFQWRDDNGKLHFGDRPPEQVDSKKVTPKTSPIMQELEITLLRQDFTLPDGIHDNTLQAIRNIYRRYRNDFGMRSEEARVGKE